MRCPGTDSFGVFQQATIGDWNVRKYGTNSSTQEAAATLPCWSVVTAEAQTAGRGQAKRRFTSDRGGLYLTAVLPFDGKSALWRGFALAVGWTVASNLRAEGIARLRLRWPNDLMIGDRKVGGILVAQGKPDTLCVGLGLNVTNRPWLEDPSLRPSSCRLADSAREEQLGFDRLLQTLLDAIRSAYASFALGGLGAFVEALNQSWGEARIVHLEMAEGAPEISGRFQGILPSGGLLLENSAGERIVVRAHLVARLREC